MDATDLTFAGAARQARLIADGEVSAREVMQATLDRIERVDPKLNAYRVVFSERALAEADQADARRAAGDDGRPLLGVPVAIKDDADVAGEVTTRGTSAHGPAVQRDSEVVRRLRQAGAIVVGKTHVPEMTIWPFTETVSHGATRNPWDLTRTPGGSSGGTGAAVAAGLAGVGLGSDGAGSIRIPAAWCGLFGMKPRRDRVPVSPHDDGWRGLTTYGPLARTVADAALFLDATAERAGGGTFVEAAATSPGGLRVALSTKLAPGMMAPLGAEQRRALEETAELLRSLGHEVVERDPAYAPSAFPNVLARYLGGIADEVAAMPYPERLEPRTRSMARLGRVIPRRVAARLRAAEPAIQASVERLFADHDVLMTPTCGGPPFAVGELHGRGALRSVVPSARRVAWLPPFNGTGHPAAAVPAGLDRDGLPMAVQLVGPLDGEAVLLSLSAQIEAARPWADVRPPLG